MVTANAGELTRLVGTAGGDVQNRRVFIDESGDENLNISSGASRFYVLAAVLVDEARAEDFLNGAEALRKYYFQSGEIKSSKIGGNHERRRKILAYARESLPQFSVVAYRVRKEAISPESGLKFPASFIKYFANDFFKYLPASGIADVKFDEKGRQKFKVDFVRYLISKFPGEDLFPKKKLEVVDSRSCVGVQLADLYAGSIAKLSEDLDPHWQKLLYGELVQTCCTWDNPKTKLWGTGGFVAEEKHDLVVRSEALERAVRYVEQASDGSEDSLLRVEFLKALIEHSMSSDDEFMLAKELESRLNQFADKPMTGQALRNRVVGPLRDYGVLISSRSARPHPGYKLPRAVRDVEEYVELAATQVIPSLRRVKSAAQSVFTATNGEVDLLSQDQFLCMRDLTQSV